MQALLDNPAPTAPTYAANDPVNNIDPSGTTCTWKNFVVISSFAKEIYGGGAYIRCNKRQDVGYALNTRYTYCTTSPKNPLPGGSTSITSVTQEVIKQSAKGTPLCTPWSPSLFNNVAGSSGTVTKDQLTKAGRLFVKRVSFGARTSESKIETFGHCGSFGDTKKTTCAYTRFTITGGITGTNPRAGTRPTCNG